jgi:hypothetical protein
VKNYSRSHVPDEVLLRNLATHLAQERAAAAELLALVAEADARGLERPVSDEVIAEAQELLAPPSEDHLAPGQVGEERPSAPEPELE